MVTFSPHLVDILYHNFLVLSNFNGGKRGAAAMEIIVSKNCGPTMFFRDLLECLLVSEGNETGKYILGLCFPMGPAATGRPPRKQGVEEEVSELTSWVGSGRHRRGPQDTLLNR